MSEDRAPPRTVIENIDAVMQLEEQAVAQRSRPDRLSDSIADFVGSLWFVAVHVVALIGWVLLNVGLIPVLGPFDPYPFPFLCMFVSLESVLVSTFVLIKQNRMSWLADQRAHLDLQVGLLSEREATKILQLLDRVASQLGIEQQVLDGETRELESVTAVDRLARELHDRRPNSGAQRRRT
ncbi:MAG: hypothetical protein JWM77_3095 [Rhodospirillales bacterium]|nr:hypothetical protein [Rhodospirillales bacterium]